MTLSRSPMPRGTQPLARTAGLARGSGLRRRTPLRQVSGKRAAENRARKVMIARLYPERPLCAVPWCLRWADDVHEPLTRARGGGICDEENQVPLCRFCHSELHDTEPEWAYDLGLLKHSKPSPCEGAGAA